ncbi:unnamed protein product [Victoria cruziana]
MSEFAPISIYLVISLLVSLIPLGVPFPFASNSSTYPEKSSAHECGLDPSVSILFIIPDQEVTFSFPWAVPPNKIDLFGSWTKERAMPTLNQLIRHGTEEKRCTERTRASDQCRQKQGVCPSLRKIAKVRLSNRHDIFAHILGEGHNLQEHTMVLIRGGRVKDSPGVKSHPIRGVKDLLGIPDRRRGRSKYGTERPKPKER